MGRNEAPSGSSGKEHLLTLALFFVPLILKGQIGLLLPCNVVVRAVEGGCRVEIADPKVMLGIVGNKQLDAIADEARQRLRRTLAALER